MPSRFERGDQIHLSPGVGTQAFQENDRTVSEPGENPYRSPVSTTEPGGPRFDRPIFLSGCMQIADARVASRLATRFFWLKWPFWTLAAGAFPGMLAYMGWQSLQLAPHAALTMLMVAGLLIGWILISVLVAVVRTRRYAKRQQGWFAPSESVVVEEGLSISRPEGVETLTWADFQSYRANHRVALLFTARTKGYLVVARSKLRDPSTWEPLLALIAAKLPRA